MKKAPQLTEEIVVQVLAGIAKFPGKRKKQKEKYF